MIDLGFRPKLRNLGDVVSYLDLFIILLLPPELFNLGNNVP